MIDPDPPTLVHRAEGLILRVAGVDATVERPGIPALHLPGEADRMRLLWGLLDAPCHAHALGAALGDARGDKLIRRLIEAEMLLLWPLATRLAQLHAATSVPETRSSIGPGCEEARLLRDYTSSAAVDLPRPTLVADLASALMARRTIRTLSGAPLKLAQVATLLAFGAGAPGGSRLPLVTGGPPGGRTYPSGGGLYPIEVLVRPIGLETLGLPQYHYQVFTHRLVASSVSTSRSVIERLFADNAVSGARIAFLLWADFTRESLGKYGEKAYRLALLEAGHIAQNLLLVATALGLSGAPLCGFDDAALALDAGLSYPEQAVVYAVAVGVPETLAVRPDDS